MKTKILSILALLLTVTQGAWAQTLPTDGTGAYLISSVDNWNTFCEDVTGGITYSGKTVKLTADIIGVTTRTGKNSVKPFSGTFDGQGHTMNLNIYTTTTDDVTSAPFGYISGATIKNLHITGSETTTAYMRAASIAGFAENSTITNCWSEVALTSGYNKDIDCGAFVATVIANSSLTLNGCLFTGTITYTDDAGYEGGGMVGWTRAGGTATLNDCLFAPAGFTVKNYSGHYMFVGGKKRGVLNNCYYNDVAAATSLTKEGKQARSISAGTDVTISGEGTEYSVSGITAYATGIKYNDVYYAGSGETVTLTYAGTKSVKSVTAKRKTTTGNITVYFTDAQNYGDVNVYYWNDGPDWPGTPMTEVGTNEYNQKIYRAEIPATPEGIIFNGNGRQTVNIIENIEDGSWWYTKEETDDSGYNKVGYVGKYTENIEVTNVDANNWTFTMPDGNVELDIEYYPAYPVTISDGDKDAANWSATPTEQSVGQNVTLQYTGKKKIKRITIEAASTARTAAEATAEDIGKLIGADGNIYDDAAAATAASTTAVAMIAYVGNDAETSTTYNHGLALALGDVSDTKNWCSQTEATCLGTGHQFDSEAGAKGDMAGIDNTDALVNNTGHAHDAASAARGYNSGTHPAGTSAWFLPSAGQWDKMAAAAGSYASLIANAGLQGGWDAAYWSSTEGGADFAWFFDSSQGKLDGYSKDEEFRVRACLAF